MSQFTVVHNTGTIDLPQALGNVIANLVRAPYSKGAREAAVAFGDKARKDEKGNDYGQWLARLPKDAIFTAIETEGDSQSKLSAPIGSIQAMVKIIPTVSYVPPEGTGERGRKAAGIDLTALTLG